MGNVELNNNIEEVLQNLRQEFIDSSQDMLADIDGLIARMRRGQGEDKAFLELRRHVHTIKGQGGTFGFPLVTHIAHMLEDYFETLASLEEEAIRDIQVFVDRIANVLDQGEPKTQKEAEAILNALPSVPLTAFSDQIVRNLRALVVMPKSIQRKIIGQELVSCGFRLNFADGAVSGLDAALAFPPHIVFASMEIPGFTGAELAGVFHSVRTLMGAHFVLLTSYDIDDSRLRDLPANTEIIYKDTDFAEQLVDHLMKWGGFGDLSRTMR